MSRNLTSYIYFLKPRDEDGPIKIGISRMPLERLVAISIWCPFEIEIAATVQGDFALERKIHDRFFNSHIRGEWFESDPMLIYGIEKLRKGVPVHAAFDLAQKEGDLRSKRKKSTRIFLPAHRQRTSYAHRLIWARKQLEKEGLTDVQIPKSCRSYTCGWTGEALTELEIARLELVLSDPRKYFEFSQARESA